MIKQLEIKNYALIQNVNLSFDKGLTIITGETGAGKSILLGGLSMILGKRAQQGLLNNPDKKSVVEASFDVSKYNLKKFFNKNDIDFEEETIIRREILKNGKSRAFINDSPVKLDVVSELTEQLIDIHSQHQTLELNQKDFQFDLIDSIASNQNLLKKYSQLLDEFKSLIQQENDLSRKLETAQQELEYKNFQLEELSQLNLDDINFEQLEQRLKQLEHSEEIGLILSEASAKIDHDEMGLHNQLIEIRNSFIKIRNLSPKFEELAERFESLQIETQDISLEIGNLIENNEFSPAEKEDLQVKFDEINRLLIKHKVLDINELIAYRNKLEEDISDLSDIENNLSKIRKKIKLQKEKLIEIATEIHQRRKKSIPKLVDQIERVLKKLSMPHTRIKIELIKLEEFVKNGMDDLDFQISSNKGKKFGNIKQIASGGELSRIMLAIKTILSKYKKLPSIVFDEIDSGISGEVAQNMADVLKYLAQNMQVIVITHLPQIAAVGEKHYKVYKENNQNIETKVKSLNKEERILEIAEMLEGKSPSESAINHAKHLLL